MHQHGDYSKGKELIWQDGINFILRKCYPDNKLRVLEIGCGDGSFLRFLRKEAKKRGIALKNVEYYGIDIAREYKNLAEEQGVKFQTGDALVLERYYEKDFFDVVIASEILEHIDETDQLIRLIKEALKRDGCLYLTTPNLASWHSRIMLLLGYQPLATEVSNKRADFGKGWIWRFYGSKKPNKPTIHHIRVFTLKALKEFLEYHGFKIESIKGGGYRPVENFVFKIFVGLSPVIKIICKKI